MSAAIGNERLRWTRMWGSRTESVASSWKNTFESITIDFIPRLQQHPGPRVLASPRRGLRSLVRIYQVEEGMAGFQSAVSGYEGLLEDGLSIIAVAICWRSDYYHAGWRKAMLLSDFAL